jgi:hypothetical protein
MNRFDELFGRVPIHKLGGFFGVHEMDAYVVLEYFRHEAGDGAANPCDHMHDAFASGFLFESAFDGIDLSTDPANPGLQFFLFSNSVADEFRIGYPAILVKAVKALSCVEVERGRVLLDDPEIPSVLHVPLR